mgnify:CR=1 FL=1
MGDDILLCWLGMTDLKAASGELDVGLGPVGQAVSTRRFAEVRLLNNLESQDAEDYAAWLRKASSARIIIHQTHLTSPTNFGEIYQAALNTISETLQAHGPDVSLVFHLSPGTPAMAAVWILLAKTRFPAELIESSMDHGVRTATVPFDISAELIPNLFRKPDQSLERMAAGLPDDAPAFDDIIHRSEMMSRTVLMARRIALRSISVLIEGESGTGKELLARAIHDASPRRYKPFVAINCGAIPPELVESELFGHEKGAFTGATDARQGHFEAAHGGTLFLDEIGDLPKPMQVKLLRTLQEGEVKRIGATQSRKVDIRIIAATNRNLIDEMAAGNFREDLFYRLAVGVIKLPPLRDRAGDVSLLINHFLERINQESGNEPGFERKKISPTAKNLLLQHRWPGNIRELKNTLTRATVWAADDEISEADIREALLPIPDPNSEKSDILDRPLEAGLSLPEIIKTVQVHYLKRAMAETQGNKTQAAEILGLPNRQTLTNWLKKYDLE